MVFPKGKDRQMEEESFLRKRMMKATQISKGSQRKKVAAEGEYLTREVEVEEEIERLFTGVTNVTNWVADLLNVLRMKIRDIEVHT